MELTTNQLSPAIPHNNRFLSSIMVPYLIGPNQIAIQSDRNSRPLFVSNKPSSSLPPLSAEYSAQHRPRCANLWRNLLPTPSLQKCVHRKLHQPANSWLWSDPRTYLSIAGENLKSTFFLSRSSSVNWNTYPTTSCGAYAYPPEAGVDGYTPWALCGGMDGYIP